MTGIYIIIIERQGHIIIKKSHTKNFDTAVRHANCIIKRDGGEVVSVTKEGRQY